MAGFWEEATEQFGPAYESSMARKEREKREQTRQKERKEDVAMKERGLRMEEEQAARAKQQHEWRAEDRTKAETMKYLKSGLAHLDFLVEKGQNEAAAVVAAKLHERFPDGREGLIVFKDNVPEDQWAQFNLDPKKNIAVVMSDTGIPQGYETMRDVVKELKALITPENYMQADLEAKKALAEAQNRAQVTQIENPDGSTRWVRQKITLTPGGIPTWDGQSWEDVKMPGRPITPEETKIKGLQRGLKGAGTEREKEQVEAIYGTMEKGVPESKIREAKAKAKASQAAKGKLTEKQKNDIVKQVEDEFKEDNQWIDDRMNDPVYRDKKIREALAERYSRVYGYKTKYYRTKDGSRKFMVVLDQNNDLVYKMEVLQNKE